MGDLASAEEQTDPNLMTLTEELASPIQLNVEVVSADLEPQSDLFDLDQLLVLLALLELLGLFVAVLAPVE